MTLEKHDAVSYSLPRDQTESQRLDLQHGVFKSSAGYLLHPDISKSLITLHEKGQQVRVADVATGTGAWIIDLAESWSYPLETYGFDISDAQFPQQPADNKQKPCQFHRLNILEPIPDQWRGVFDVVHVRLLVCGITSPDWVVAARNIFDMLKPDGWIQWHEIDGPSITVYPNVPGAPTKCGQEMVNKMALGQRRWQKFMREDFIRFKDRVESVGFKDCKLHKPSSDRDPAYRMVGSKVVHGAVKALLHWSVKHDPDLGWTKEEVDGLSSKAMAELDDPGCYWRWDMYIVTGRKPFL